MINQQLHNYKIIALLGEGGMANVYLAEHLTLKGKVAIKFLKDEFVANKNIRKRFLAEARSLAQMSHPNIIKVTDLIDAGDIVAFVMECIEGQTLDEYIKVNGVFRDDEIGKYLPKMLKAIEYVHAKGFIHRDIKPSNFMLTKDHEIKLLDFGIAKNTNSDNDDYTSTNLGQQMGTLLYMSPEQIECVAPITKLTDIYSLGVTLWFMVMGHSPYNLKAISILSLQNKIHKEPLPLTQTLWDSTIQEATAKDPTKRSLKINSKKGAAKKPQDRSIHKSPLVFLEDTILEEKTLSFPLKRPDIESSMFIGDLEIKTKDLGKMDWYRAEKSCENLGDGWRLPSEKELVILFGNKEEIGGFANYYYWSSNEYNDYIACSKNFNNGNEGTNDKTDYRNVRAVRTV